MRTLLNNIYHARRSDSNIRKVESCLSEDCIHSLINNLELKDLSKLLDEEESLSTIEVKYLSISDSHLGVEFAETIEQLHEKLKHDPDFTCCSCERLLENKAVTLISLQINSAVLLECS